MQQYNVTPNEANSSLRGTKQSSATGESLSWGDGFVPRHDERTKFTKTAFVSTNSISQGEQVGILWNELFNKYKIKIHFAHRTFSWSHKARGNAAVHVVIIGFANFDVLEKEYLSTNTLKDYRRK